MPLPTWPLLATVCHGRFRCSRRLWCLRACPLRRLPLACSTETICRCPAIAIGELEA